MNLQWHHWAILGIALVVSELAVPAFVLVWFGLGALAVAALLAIAPATDFNIQLLVWTVCSVALVIVWFKIFKPGLTRTLSGRSQAGAIGEVGILTGAITPFAKAQVRFQQPVIGSDVWDCVADENIDAGTRVEIVSVDGSILKVKKEKNP
ncbi:MAG: NfeD family protein [Alphaproteobacteria bacterium]|nr:NfeD family protein [Alphaproteobacteria bacterium]